MAKVDYKELAKKNKGKKAQEYSNSGVVCGYNEELGHLIIKLDKDQECWSLKESEKEDFIYDEYKSKKSEYMFVSEDAIIDPNN